MSDTMRSHTNIQTLSMPIWVYRISTTLKRIKRALEYAFGTLSADHAQDMLLDCCDGAGWFPILILDAQETLCEARLKYQDHPALPGLIKAACARVSHRWEDLSSALHEARSWTIQCAEETARANNIQLIPLDGWDESDPLSSQPCFEEAKSGSAAAALVDLSTQVLCLPAPVSKPGATDEDADPGDEGKIITLDEMIESLVLMEHPASEAYKSIVEAIGTLIAGTIAHELGVNASAATFKETEFGGTCSKFTPAFPGQACPYPLDNYDTGVWRKKAE